MKNNLQIMFGLFFIGYACQTKMTDSAAIECVASPEIENNNLRHIFKPCRTFIYEAKYWDESFDLISDEKIRVEVPGRGWYVQPESQDEIVIKYEHDPADIDRLQAYSLNAAYEDWTSADTTGIIETERQVWMHPFRSNQYTFTEIAPFPQVELPLSVGMKWAGGLNIGGWGLWNNSQVQYTFEVLSYGSINTALETLDAWHIYSIGTSPYGTSTQDFWFHEQYGFIKIIVKNPKNHLLQFEMVEVIDNMIKPPPSFESSATIPGSLSQMR